MKKKISIFAACVVGVVCLAFGASAAGVIQYVQSEIRPDFTVVVDGQVRTFQNAQGETVYPLLYDGTTYLPVRAIGNLMGKTVYWYENEKRIELKDSTSTVTDADVIVDGQATPQPSADEISLDRAKEIALAEAGISADGVTFTKARLERDDGVQQYDIEFWKDGVEYSAEIRASDGAILSWDVDRESQQSAPQTNESGEISLDRAKEIALAEAGIGADGVQFTETQLERDDGVRKYEIEFWKDGVEYSAEIRASDGFILSWDVDHTY